MKTNPKQKTIGSLHARLKDKINLSDKRFQRGSVWAKGQEQFLIDTIVKNLDIPKLYFWELKEDSHYKYSVVDGQQRLATIFKFLDGLLELNEEFTPEYANKKFIDLPEDLQDQIYNYELTLVIIENADEEEIQDLFLRLNNGTTLKSQERRMNLGGNLSKYIVDMANHKVFSKVIFKNKHRDYEQILAQCLKLELEGKATNTQGKYLDLMYKEEIDFEDNGTTAKKFKKVLDYMEEVFSDEDKIPELKRFNFISLYLMVSQMTDKFVIKDKKDLFKKFLIDFWDELTNYRNQEQISDEDRNLEFDDFIQFISSRTDSLESIEGRHKILIKYFMLKNPNLEIFDNNRNFTEEQRITIYRRDKEMCWHCNKHVDWVDFEADHRPNPHSKGGKTSVENGVCAHKICNIKASNKENLAKNWLS
ncbi:MAG: hypothetical protein QT05_C0038G0006 [archaeon GW2011_AR13]|nr:MAG: hypothetical protein QT05_C0038G0006 [archaeon GW2011_AR13]HIG94778.1 DUF262 domain-containing protein [Nanoarchaeota archaeon]HIH63744.1 DUF262 domain-containing protein [Nanoarchaeota archaeon]HIJ09617.1 DUF262 domain-containing protein [Nanoarchaeota archaeon]